MRYDPKIDGEDVPQVEAAREEIGKIYAARRWAKLEVKRRGEVDQFAVDTAGRLVLIELKDASKRSAEVYYAPFQLLRYVWEWRNALRASPPLREQIQALIDARVAVHLTPKGTAPLSGRIRAVIGFGRDERTAEVRRRYGEVLEVVRSHWPPNVDFIEAWAFTESGLQQIGSA